MALGQLLVFLGWKQSSPPSLFSTLGSGLLHLRPKYRQAHLDTLKGVDPAISLLLCQRRSKTNKEYVIALLFCDPERQVEHDRDRCSQSKGEQPVHVPNMRRIVKSLAFKKKQEKMQKICFTRQIIKKNI